MKTAILMMAHGSRIAEANGAARDVAVMVQEMTGFEIVEVSFRELHEPNIQCGIDACVSKGAERILLMPYFLFMGAHVQHDLPEEIEIAKKRHPGLMLMSAPNGAVTIIPIKSAIRPAQATTLPTR